MSGPVEALNGEQASRWVDRLRRAEVDVQQGDDGTLSMQVLRECMRLWADVLHALGLYTLEPGVEETREARISAQSSAPVTRLEQARVETIVVQFGSVDLSNPTKVHELAHDSLIQLDGQLSALVEPTNSGPGRAPFIFSESQAAWVDGRAMLTAWRGRSQLLQESLRVLHLLDTLHERTQPVLASTKAANEEAVKAAARLDSFRAELEQVQAKKAQGTLSAQFKKLRNREHGTSWFFRFATLAIAGAAIAVAVAVPTKSDWPEVAAHLAIVAILGGASAYTARLASAHRGTGDWADSLRVQLDTFQDFLGVLDDDAAKTRVYEEFGRRVLGSPPSVNGEAPESGAMPTAQLAQLVSDVANASARR
jgi:hypothetical protein